MASVYVPTSVSTCVLFLAPNQLSVISDQLSVIRLQGSLILCVISLNYYRSDQSLCPLCLEWFLPLPRQQDCILEYILPTKPKRAITVLSGQC